MTWPEIYQLLDREYEQAFAGMAGKRPKIPDLPDPDDRGASESIRSLEEEADLACAHFAEHRRWPLIRPEVAWQVLWRLQQCRAFAKFVSCPDFPKKYPAQSMPLRVSDAFILRWMLCDFWKVAGIWRRIYRLSGDNEDEE